MSLQKSSRRKNNRNAIGSDSFAIIDYKGIAKSFTFDWECSSEKKEWAQHMIYQSNNYVRVTEENVIEVRSSLAVHTEVSFLKKICLYWERVLPTKPLYNWGRENIKGLLESIMIRTVLEDGKFILYSSVRLSLVSYIFLRSHHAFIDGKVPDGLSFILDAQCKRDAMAALFEHCDINYAEWNTSGSYGSVPLTINSLMLGNSIRVIESEDTLVAICFFRAWKKSPRYVAGCFRAATQSGKDILETHSILRNSLGTILADELAKVSLEHITRLPWNTVAEFTNFCRFVGRACLTILLSLSGHRLGELMSTQSTHWEYRNEEMFVKEEIEKTLDSISIPRHFSRLCETAAKTLWSLSYVNVDMYSVPLFHRGHSSTLAKIICKGGNVQQWIYTYAALNDNTLREWLNDYYNYHIIPLCPEIKYVHPEINPHQFRHSWAEFALRRFDDNVEPKIREHFLHKSFGATRKYTDGKLKESVRYSLEHDYLYDIVNRIDQNPLRKEFMGPAYLRVKKELQKLKILHLNDADAYIDEIVQSVESFLAFEWGFCVLFKDSKNNAKCHDRFTGFPNPHGRGSVKLCTNCPNSMNNLTQRDALIRIAYSHTYIVENHPIKAIGELSADIIRQIERRLEEK